ERVTTGSMEALRKYSQAVRLDDAGQAAPAHELLKEAVAVDSTFAMAWGKLAVVGARVGVPEQEWRRAMTRAFELRVRLPASERHRTEAAYHMAVTEDTERALAAYRAVLQLEPGNRAALNNSALILTGMARYVEAEAMARQSIAVAGASWFSYTHLLNSVSGQGRYAEADSVVREMTRLFPGNPRVTGAAAMTAYD